MKLQADRLDGSNAIARHGPEGVLVNGREYRHSVLVPWTGEVQAWPIHDFAAIEARHFELILATSPELVIFGSGSRLRFVKPALLKALYERRIGVETMDTAAACRTYNVLLAEGRTVLAALLFEPLAQVGG
jgi:uncharacterized protein